MSVFKENLGGHEMSTINELSSLITSQSVSGDLRPKPDPEEKFNDLDTDGNGTLDTVELSEVAKEIASMTGQEFNADEFMAQYDSDGDGELSKDEMDTMMRAMGPPPEDVSSSVWEALQSYLNNAGEETDNILLSLKQQTPPPPPPQDPQAMFDELDTDDSDGLSADELASVVDDFLEKRGISIDTEEAMTSYDEDGNGELSFEEMDKMMQDLRPNQNDESGVNTRLQQLLEQYQSAGDDEKLTIMQQIFGNNGILNT